MWRVIRRSYGKADLEAVALAMREAAEAGAPQ
jgi:hypothetical protein